MSSRTLMTKPAWSHVRATPLSIKPIKMLFCVLNLSPLRLILIKVTHRTTCCSARPKTESSKSGTYKTKYSWTKCSVTIKESLTCIRSILKKQSALLMISPYASLESSKTPIWFSKFLRFESMALKQFGRSITSYSQQAAKMGFQDFFTQIPRNQFRSWIYKRVFAQSI